MNCEHEVTPCAGYGATNRQHSCRKCRAVVTYNKHKRIYEEVKTSKVKDYVDGNYNKDQTSSWTVLDKLTEAHWMYWYALSQTVICTWLWSFVELI